jgi:hypothetical protein
MEVEMKTNLLITLLFFLLVNSLIFSQSIGVSAGYGSLNMDKVNKDMNDVQKLFSDEGAVTSSPDEISGGIFYEGNVKYSINNVNLGISGDYISSSGSFAFADNSVSFNQNYDVSTIEVLLLGELLIPIENSAFQPFIQLAGGIGFATAERTIDIAVYEDPNFNVSAINSVDGNYFSGRIKAGVGYIVQNIIIEIAGGYRIANAEELKGDYTVDGTTLENTTVNNITNNVVIEFDYSGFIVTAGISYEF